MKVGARPFLGISRLTAETRRQLRTTLPSFSPKDGSCIGCGGILTLRLVSQAINFEAERAKWIDPSGSEKVGGLGVMLTEHTGCMQVVTTTADTSAWMDRSGLGRVRSMLHNSFSDGTSNLIGLYAVYQARVRGGNMPLPFYFWSFAGDGGATIGMGQISSFFQVGKGLLVVYDNRLYANTGGQESATSLTHGSLATAPVGETIIGSQNIPRDLIKIAAAHEVPFAATASIAHPNDLMEKVRYAINVDGPTFIWVDAPCPKEQGFPEDQTRHMAELAVESGYWPLVRYQAGQWAVDYLRSQERTGNPVSLEAFVGGQARSSHIARKGFEPALARLSAEAEKRYAWFLKQAEVSGEAPSLYAPEGIEFLARRLEEF